MVHHWTMIVHVKLVKLARAPGFGVNAQLSQAPCLNFCRSLIASLFFPFFLKKKNKLLSTLKHQEYVSRTLNAFLIWSLTLRAIP